MKQVNPIIEDHTQEEMLDEYDFSDGVRGKFAGSAPDASVVIHLTECDSKIEAALGNLDQETLVELLALGYRIGLADAKGYKYDIQQPLMEEIVNKVRQRYK